VEYRACLRCGSLDLAMPGTQDAVALEGGQLMAWVCRRCGMQSAPVVFQDKADWERFEAERAVLFKPGPPPDLPPDLERPRKRSPWMTGLAAVMGFVFLSAAALIFLTAARVGGDAWFTMAPSGIVALLLGLPFAAMAARR
jgi:hypothetical protein